MSRLRDQLVPIVAGVLVVVVGVSVVLLLRAANDQGISALKKAKLQQVDTTANSFNARVSTSLESAKGLGKVNWQLTPHSAADQRILNTYALDPNAQSGFFLINSSDVVTDGVLLRPGALGSRFTRLGWAQAKRMLDTNPVAVLPVTPTGLTTELPNYAFVVGIDGPGQTLRGALVLETAVTPDSAFETEIRQLADPSASTAAWFFIDSRGSVIATSQATGLGKPIEDRRYLKVPLQSVSDIGDRIVMAANIPSVHWRVVFRQNRAQFENGVSGPLQEAGLILVLLLLAVGLTLVVILIRRLREAREQERRLRDLTRSQSEFISVVSHELRTPVAGVLGFLQTTVDHWDTLSDAERLATVRRAVANARRLQAMTRDVLDTESLESGRIGYSFSTVDLMAELDTAVEGSRNADPSHVVTLTGPSVPITVDADPDRLQQVLANLLENARRNSPSDEPISVETEVVEDGSRGPKVRVSVIDHGPGVSAESVERIFEKFVRGNDNAVTGTGLGLYIVRTIIEAHHGRIWCESDPGRRTAFVFELPLAAAPVRSAT